MLEAIVETLVKSEDVVFIGWGTFSVAERAAKKGRNPKPEKKFKQKQKKL